MLPNGDDALTAAPDGCPNENTLVCPKADGAAPVVDPNGVVAVDAAPPPNNGEVADATGFQNWVAGVEVAVSVVTAAVCPKRDGATEATADEGIWPNGDGTEDAAVGAVVVCPNGTACPNGTVIELVTAVEPNMEVGIVVAGCSCPKGSADDTVGWAWLKAGATAVEPADVAT